MLSFCAAASPTPLALLLVCPIAAIGILSAPVRTLIDGEVELSNSGRNIECGVDIDGIGNDIPILGGFIFGGACTVTITNYRCAAVLVYIDLNL